MVYTVHRYYPLVVFDLWVWLAFFGIVGVTIFGSLYNVSPILIQRISLLFYLGLIASRRSSQIWIYPILCIGALLPFYLYYYSFFDPRWKLLLKEFIFRGFFLGNATTFIKYYLDYQQVTCFELKEIEKKMGDLNQKLMTAPSLLQSQKMEILGRLAGGVAHDFNNALAVIKPTVQLLQKNPKYLDISTELQTIEAASIQAENVVKQLLSFSRKDSPQHQPLDIHSLFKDLVRLLGNLVDSEIDLKYECPDYPLFILGDKTQIQQSFLNVILNAKDAVTDVLNPAIKIRLLDVKQNVIKIPSKLSSSDSYVVLEVSDNGIGVSEKIKSLVFDPFFTTKDPGYGTGLGLSVAYAIMNQHDGALCFDSEEGVGTTVSLFFPLVSRKSCSEDLSLKNELIPVVKNTTVLIVDDDDLVLNATERLFKLYGFQITTAQTGEEAIEMMRKACYDLVVLDYQMPKMDGLDCYFELKSIHNNINAIIYTGNLFCERLLSTIQSEKKHLSILYKPLDVDKLEKILLTQHIISLNPSDHK